MTWFGTEMKPKTRRGSVGGLPYAILMGVTSPDFTANSVRLMKVPLSRSGHVGNGEYGAALLTVGALAFSAVALTCGPQPPTEALLLSLDRQMVRAFTRSAMGSGLVAAPRVAKLSLHDDQVPRIPLWLECQSEGGTGCDGSKEC